jgi:hypothetical protein
MDTNYTGDNMTLLYTLLAIDIIFGIAIWRMARDHRAKMDEIYAKWDAKYPDKTETE